MYDPVYLFINIRPDEKKITAGGKFKKAGLLYKFVDVYTYK